MGLGSWIYMYFKNIIKYYKIVFKNLHIIFNLVMISVSTFCMSFMRLVMMSLGTMMSSTFATT